MRVLLSRPAAQHTRLAVGDCGKMPLILVVDDVELNVELLERKLENGGFETVRAVSGASALDAAQKHLPDLILLDVMMPTGSRFAAGCAPILARRRSRSSC